MSGHTHNPFAAYLNACVVSSKAAHYAKHHPTRSGGNRYLWLAVAEHWRIVADRHWQRHLETIHTTTQEDA